MKILSQQPEHPLPNINLKVRSRPSVLRTPDCDESELSQFESWPPVGEWTRRQQALAAKTFRKLGVEPERIAANGVWSSQAMKVLGPDSFAEFTGVRTAGKVIWCNFELARQLGFDVPQSNQLTPEFQEQLLAALAFRVAKPGEDLSGQSTITMYADKYGGDGLGPALGAGRAGFLSYGNIYVKGIGFTPLFKHNDADDFAHSHGAVHLDDCLTEAVFGEVNENLFSLGSTRILAIIDEGRSVIPPTGKPIPVALVVRTGAQLRPAHLLTRLRSKRALLDKFISITGASGQLVTRRDFSTGDELPDLNSTILRIIDDHARTAAESFRWRMIHGALSASNMEISGAMLDLPTQSTQPRTAPVWCLDYTGSIFGAEHTERAVHLIPIHKKLMRNIPLSEWPQFNLSLLSIKSEMAKAYARHLQVKLLSAGGLKTEVAIRIQAEHESLARSFVEVILKMASLRNRGPLWISKEAAEHVCPLDVFSLLKQFPRDYFTNPEADHAPIIFGYLKPIFRGNRFHVAKKQRVVDGLINEFAGVYSQLMKSCESYINTYYDDLTSMQASIATRAAFENEPLDFLYSRRLYDDFRKAIATYRSTGNAQIIRDAIDQRIAASLRNMNGLLAQGDSRRLNGGGIELEMHNIDGINYSVRAWNDEMQSRRLHVSIPVERKRDHFVTRIPNLPRLTKRQIPSICYRFTTDGWKNSREVGARLTHDEHGSSMIEFDILCAFPLIGRLDGAFYLRIEGDPGWPKATPRFGGYVFAIPDRQELNGMLAGLS
jgi:hypothetical protein